MISDHWRIDTAFTDRWHYIDSRGDTIFKTDSVVVYVSKVRHDTVREVQTVPQPYEVPVEVEKELTWAQALFIGLGKGLAVVIVIWLAVGVVKLCKFFKN